MQKNVGGLDRIARLVIGIVLLAVGIGAVAGVSTIGLGGTGGAVLTGLVLLVGVILVVTGAIQQCPLNELLGIDTYGGNR